MDGEERGEGEEWRSASEDAAADADADADAEEASIPAAASISAAAACGAAEPPRAARPATAAARTAKFLAEGEGAGDERGDDDDEEEVEASLSEEATRAAAAIEARGWSSRVFFDAATRVGARARDATEDDDDDDDDRGVIIGASDRAEKEEARIVDWRKDRREVKKTEEKITFENFPSRCLRISFRPLSDSSFIAPGLLLLLFLTHQTKASHDD